MNPNAPRSSSELDRLIQAVIEDAATPEQQVLLNEMLRADPAARRRYIETMDLHATLADASGPLRKGHAPDLPDVLGEIIDAAVENRQRHAAELEASRALSESFRKERELLARREAARSGRGDLSLPLWIVWGGILAAAAVIVLAFTALLPGPGATVPPQVTQTPGGGQKSRSAHALPVGRVTAVVEARWSDGRFASDRDIVYQGERMSLASGVVEVQLDSGVVITLEGPVDLTSVSDVLLSVERGKMVCRIPEHARDFSVQTDAVTIANSGTEFALHARRGRDSLVHAFSGTVRLEPGRSSQSFEPVVIGAGVAFAAESSGAPHAVAADPNAFYRVVPSAYELYVNELSPLAWWSFSKPVEGWFPDRGRAGADARASSGLTTIDALHGRAVQMNISSEPLRLRDSGSFNLTGNFSVEVWIRVDRSTLASSRVFSNRAPNRDVGFGLGLAGRSLASISTCRDADGRIFQPDPLSVKFTLFGRMDLITEQPIPVGEWVQIVLVCSSHHPTRLYINGEPARAGTQIGYDHNAYDLWQSAGPVYASSQAPIIGRNPTVDDPEPFAGDLDELVIYSQPLSDRTVRALYERAVAGAP